MGLKLVGSGIIVGNSVYLVAIHRYLNHPPVPGVNVHGGKG